MCPTFKLEMLWPTFAYVHASVCTLSETLFSSNRGLLLLSKAKTQIEYYTNEWIRKVHYVHACLQIKHSMKFCSSPQLFAKILPNLLLTKCSFTTMHLQFVQEFGMYVVSLVWLKQPMMWMKAKWFTYLMCAAFFIQSIIIYHELTNHCHAAIGGASGNN